MVPTVVGNMISINDLTGLVQPRSIETTLVAKLSGKKTTVTTVKSPTLFACWVEVRASRSESSASS